MSRDGRGRFEQSRERGPRAQIGRRGPRGGRWHPRNNVQPQARHQFHRQRRDFRKVLGIDDENPCRGVAQRAGKIVTDQAGIQRRPHPAGLAHTDPGEHLFGAVEHQARHALARRETGARQVGGDAVGQIVQFAVGQRAAVDLGEDAVAVRVRLSPDQFRHAVPWRGPAPNEDRRCGAQVGHRLVHLMSE